MAYVITEPCIGVKEASCVVSMVTLIWLCAISDLLAKSENGRHAQTSTSWQPFSLVAYSLKKVKIRISRGLPGFASKIRNGAEPIKCLPNTP